MQIHSYTYKGLINNARSIHSHMSLMKDLHVFAFQLIKSCFAGT